MGAGLYQPQLSHQFTGLNPQRQLFSHQSMQHQQENKAPIHSINRAQSMYLGVGTGINGLTVGSQPVSQYHVQKYQDEIKHLKLVVDRLCSKLKDYQQQFRLPEDDIHQLIVQEPSQIEKDVFLQVIGDPVTSMLSQHLLGPLLMEYEVQTNNLERELKATKMEVQRQAEELRLTVRENDELSNRLEVQQREYLKLVEETRDNADILAMRTGSLKGANSSPEGDNNNRGESGIDEVRELRERVHLLTEENHVLFEQITLLRSHYDKYNEEITGKMQEAEYKSQAYDIVHADLQKLQQERDELQRANVFLDRKLTETSQLLSVIEEERRQDQGEMIKMREQLQTFQKEYMFYKQLSERVEFKQHDEMEVLLTQIKLMSEREKDYKIRVDDLERENSDLSMQCRQAIADIQRLQRDMKQLMAVNDEFQLQGQQFKDREQQFNELAKEYRERLEQLKFERERLAIKEEQFLRQVQKTESQSKADNKRYQEKYESMMHARKREYDRKVEELEEKLGRAQDEVDECKRKNEKVDQMNWGMRKQLDDIGKKEERSNTQYERIIEQLKTEVKEKEREKNAVELKEGYAKQEVVKESKELEKKYSDLKEQYDKQQKDSDEKIRELQRQKEETAVLKATVSEADKSRELLVREMTHTKDIENDKVREIERSKEAEIRLLEKLNDALKKEKKDTEERLEEAIAKQDLIRYKYDEEHHNTVKYFENLVANYKIQIQKMQFPERDTAMAQGYASRLVSGLNESISHFHAVNYCKEQLCNNGFTEIKEVDQWKLEGGKGYYFTRNNSTLVAFTIGEKAPKEGVSLFKIIGCHTDSPVLKLAPVTKMNDKVGFQQVAVQLYGGGLWHTWFDRDLGLAGKIIVNHEGKLVSKYWRSKDAILKIPNLAIHLTDRSNTFEPNKETHTKPILATSVIDQLCGEGVLDLEDDKYNVDQKHFKSLMNLISTDLGIDRSTIVDFELNVVDTQPAQIMGLHKEFISSGRLDNLGSSLTAMDAIIESTKDRNQDHSEVSMIMLFDHEEIGSQSAQGADSNMAAEITLRIFEGVLPEYKTSDYFRSIRRSFLVSADMAHGVHPNYQEKHQSMHQPRIHQGIVLKNNANQRYTTDAVGSCILRAIADKVEVPLQDFIVKNDSACGSTIGPMMAAKAGIKTVDIGAPMLGMHSIRETCGVIDVWQYKKLFLSFFDNYSQIPNELLTE